MDIRYPFMTKQNGYRAKLSESVVERLREYWEKGRHHWMRAETIGHPGQGTTVEDVIDELLKEAGF